MNAPKRPRQLTAQVIEVLPEEPTPEDVDQALSEHVPRDLHSWVKGYVEIHYYRRQRFVDRILSLPTRKERMELLEAAPFAWRDWIRRKVEAAWEGRKEAQHDG